MRSRGAVVSVFVSFLFAARLASAEGAKPGDIVRVEAASLTLGGELVSDDADALRLRLESGVIAIPRSLVTSVTVVRSAPAPAQIAAPQPAGAPSLDRPRGAWLSRWGSGLTFSATAGSGGSHSTPVEGGRAVSGGASLGYERSFPFVATGGSIGFDQMRETLLASGDEGCPSHTGDCLSFPDGLQHSTSSFGASLYVKPYFMYRRVRPWIRVGGEAVFVQYSYSSRRGSFGSGDATAFGVRYGGGLDLATRNRRMVFSLGIDAGGAHYREKIPRLFGAPWETDDAGAHSTDARLELGMTLPLGGGR